MPNFLLISLVVSPTQLFIVTTKAHCKGLLYTTTPVKDVSDFLCTIICLFLRKILYTWSCLFNEVIPITLIGYSQYAINFY